MSRSLSLRNGRGLVRALVLVALAMWAPRAAAYPSYDDGEGEGCVECHNNSSEGGGFTGGSSVGTLHLKHLTVFGITNCGLCHTSSSGGQLLVLTYSSGQGYGCAGCHGLDYGETSLLGGQPKATAYGLRALHAHEGVTGLEVSNSDDIVVSGNEAYDNSVGIGLYMQPGLQRKESNRWTVEKNYAHDNNRENTAPPRSMAADLPTGGGILLLGPDSSVLRENRIENNDFYGIAVIDYCFAVAGSAFDCTDNPPDFDPSPDNNEIRGNRLENNGTAPPDHPAKALAADIVLLGGTDNCFDENEAETSNPEDLPPCLDSEPRSRRLPHLRR